MKHLIISFKSRNELYSFARILKSQRISFLIINSPKSIGSSCMLSIKVGFSNINLISQLLKQYQPKSFLGLYSLQQTPHGEQTNRLM